VPVRAWCTGPAQPLHNGGDQMSPGRCPNEHAGRRGLAVAAAALCALLAGSGCITIYQPLSSLQRPSVVDASAPNFEGLHLLVRCLPGDYLGAADSQRLCRHVATLFRNQGAEVETQIPRQGRAMVDPEAVRRPDLIIELTSRLIHKEDSKLLYVLSGVTYTLVPAYSEHTFAQEITIRDASGFLLSTEVLQARFIDYFGLGIWGVNWLLDVLVRPKEDELTGSAAHKDFSRDYYRHLSQQAFNARIRQVVLQQFEPDLPVGRN
jgi:hypothetical protein